MFSSSERSNSSLSNEYKINFLAYIYVRLLIILWQRLYLISNLYRSYILKFFQFICDFNKNLIANIIYQYLLIYKVLGIVNM